MKITTQKGVGLVEVLVALVLLAIGVLGFSLLQMRAIDATQESTQRVTAMNLAMDLTERVRLNRAALETYKTAINQKDVLDTCKSSGTSTTYLPNCNANNMAKQDAKQILDKATQAEQTIIINNCIATTNLQCIYVAWGETNISASSTSECVNQTTGSYLAGSKCLVVEAF